MKTVLGVLETRGPAQTFVYQPNFSGGFSPMEDDKRSRRRWDLQS